MYNEPRNVVSVFKDYLIYDDFSEYLKRYYSAAEAHDRMPRILSFYEKYSHVYPNYVAMPIESAFMFKNIERKQKLIDAKNKRANRDDDSKIEKKAALLKGNERLFDTDFIAENAVPPDPSDSDDPLVLDELMPPPVQSRASKVNLEGPSAHDSLSRILLNLSGEMKNNQPMLNDSLMASFIKNANPYENDLNGTGVSLSFNKCQITSIDNINFDQ